jgi:hypothetical protein
MKLYLTLEIEHNGTTREKREIPSPRALRRLRAKNSPLFARFECSHVKVKGWGGLLTK